MGKRERNDICLADKILCGTWIDIRFFASKGKKAIFWPYYVPQIDDFMGLSFGVPCLFCLALIHLGITPTIFSIVGQR